jgi:tRNA-specific 2-thiouridylase
MMFVLAAMSGGVDSSVAAAVLRDDGHEVVGVTMKLWGGDSDRGCCSVSDVDDARRVAQQLGIEHLVFNFGDDFARHVVDPYVEAHAAGRTPNPCIECNRHLKFDRLLDRAEALGFDAVATGHHARIVEGPDGGRRLARATDAAKDQSYVLHVLDGVRLARVELPIGGMTKTEVRARAADLGLRTAHKPDSQDVCFISHRSGGRATFLGSRIPMRSGRLLDREGAEVGEVDAVELVTVGQRRGLGTAGDGSPRYAISVDAPAATVVVGGLDELLVDGERTTAWTWVDDAARSRALDGTGGLVAQASAHGSPAAVAEIELEVDVAVEVDGPAGAASVRWVEPQRRVAPGQSLVLYDGDVVLGGGTVTGSHAPG